MNISVDMFFYMLSNSLFLSAFSENSSTVQNSPDDLLSEIIFQKIYRKTTKNAQNDTPVFSDNIRKIRIWNKQINPDKDCLYLVDSAVWMTDKNHILETITDNYYKESGSAAAIQSENVHLFVHCNPYAPFDLQCTVPDSCSLDSITFIKSSVDFFEFAELVNQIRVILLEWDIRFVKGILNNTNPEELFISINELIDRDFAIVNVDMQYVYCTEGYAASRSLPENRILPTSLFQDLVSQKQFHEIAKNRGAFYYYTDAVDVLNLCQNIFVKDQYIARIVMSLHENETKLPPGAVQIFEVYANHIQDMFIHNSVSRTKSAKEEMHGLCNMLLNNQPVNMAAMIDIMDHFRWRQGDEFLVILLRFNTEKGWNAPLNMMLPFLCTVLENEWPGCFTFYMHSDIMLVLDFSKEKDLDSTKKMDETLRKLAYFVRENTCKAGVSPIFTDFSQLSAAVKCATTALEIGMATKPYLWYFLFDELRLAYMLKTINTDLPPDMLVHPAIHTLTRYDQLHKSELNRTLYLYLKNNLNMTTASNELYIHRTSFCRRINQIKQLTNINLEDPNTILTLLLSYRILYRIV